MISFRFILGASLSCLCGLCLSGQSQTPLSQEQQSWISRAKRSERAGWIYLHTEGDGHQRGFQHGYLLAKEITEGLRLTRASWERHSGMEWPWLVERAAAMFVTN